MDLSSIQPSIVPSNVEFLVGDFTTSWDFDRKFDYIHSRAITIGVQDWIKLVDEAWHNLEPGGWVEF
jgi:trans-aconitate methyltransferase